MWLIVLSRFWRRLPRLLRFLSRRWRSTLQCVLNSSAYFRRHVLHSVFYFGARVRHRIAVLQTFLDLAARLSRQIFALQFFFEPCPLVRRNFDAAERSFDFRPDFRGEVFSLQFIPNLGAIFRRKIYRIEVGRLDRVVDCKEKQNACEKIKSQRMHITHAMTREKLVRQFPWTNYEKSDRCE